ncbi:MAG: hypothetical protein JST09_06955 [Bacteroidetes bacterium]|nr:hypothetical protein [Bacteroidota bacterium]
MKLSLFVVVLFSFNIGSYGQSSKEKHGQVILKDGTLLEGTFRLKASRNTPQQFEFTRDNTNSPVVLTPNNTKSVNINDSIFYVSENLRLYTNTTATDLISNDTAQAIKEGVFFGERAVKGDKLSLFLLTDEEKNHFIIEDTTGSFQALQYVRYIDNTNGINNVRDLALYKKQLLQYAEGRENVLKKIMDAKFELDDLLSVVVAINTNNTIGKKAAEETKRRKLIYVYAEVALMSVSIDYSGIPKSLSAMNFSGEVYPKLAIGGEMHLGRQEKLLISLSAGLYPFKINGTEHENNGTGTPIEKYYRASGISIIFQSLYEYAFFRFKKSQIALGIGYGLNINRYSKNSYTSTDKNPDGSNVILDQLRLGGFWGQYSLLADYFLNHKLSLYVGFAPAQDFSNMLGSKFTQSHLGIGAKFRF